MSSAHLRRFGSLPLRPVKVDSDDRSVHAGGLLYQLVMVDSDSRCALELERLSAMERVETLKAEFAWLAGDAEEANGDDEHDPEGSTLAFERARVAALLADADSNLRALELALTKLAGGSYGLCESCGKAITPDRLEALPAARNCIDCASASRSG
jgi:DnaK suppressor protein